MHTYRVWFTDGSAVVIDATDKTHCQRIIKEGVRTGKYHGKIASIETLN